MTEQELREKLDYILDWHSRCRAEIKEQIPGYADPKYAEEKYDGIVKRHRNEAIQLITQYGDTRERLGRLNELTSLFSSYERDGIGINYTVYNEWVRKRVAELKEKA